MCCPQNLVSSGIEAHGFCGVWSLDTELTALHAAQALAEVCAVCNDARIEAHGGVFRAAGAPTEAALVVRCMPSCVRAYTNLA